MTPTEVVQAYWRVMGSNDFAAASLWLTEDVTVDWPQSGERIRGRENFAAINTAYPANGLWRFDVRRLVAQGKEVVTEVGVTDGSLEATVLTFHTVEGCLILRQVEYWPDPYKAPEWRAEWVERV